MKIKIKSHENTIDAIARQSNGMIGISLSKDYTTILLGDALSPEVLELDHDEAMTLLEDLSELVSHMGEIG